MEFKKYNSIENMEQKSFIKSLLVQGFGDLEYVVQEKVHGANLSFTSDGEKVLSAKRTGWIEEGEDFYNVQQVEADYRSRVLALSSELMQQYGAKTVSIFGELFGGGYPHAEVTKVAGAKIVQQGIYYSPANDFYAFDICIDQERYLDADTANALFAKHGFLYAQTLFRGSLADCMDYPNEFKTTIPQLLHLPEIEGNCCEGVVIRPVQPSFLQIGSRVIIKNKNDRWSENNKHIDKAVLKQVIRQEGDELSEEAQALCELVYEYITTNRLNNLLSKLGAVNFKKDFGKVCGMYSKDVLTDFLKSHQAQYDALEKPEAKAINRFVNQHASNLISEEFMDMQLKEMKG
ncbi:MAG: RNA ligase, Rnl2 family [Mangrovibacterium sp.]